MVSKRSNETEAEVDIVVPADGSAGASADSLARSLIVQTNPRWRLRLDRRYKLSISDPRISKERTPKFDSKVPYSLVLGPSDILDHRALELLLSGTRDETPRAVYSDEIVVNPITRFESVALKPAWSPTVLFFHRYTGDPLLMPTATVAALEPALDEGSLHKLALAATKDTEPAHVPAVLLRRPRRRLSDPPIDAINSALVQRQIAAAARLTESGVAIDPALGDRPTVAIVIPTAGATTTMNGLYERHIDRCLASIKRHTRQPMVEVIVVADTDVDAATRRHLQLLGPGEPFLPIKVINRPPGPFNFSTANMSGVLETQAEVVMFVNDDIEIQGPDDWLDRMLIHALRPDTGLVGAVLHYPNGLIQHAGVALVNGLPLHIAHNQRQTEVAAGDRDVFAVTGACVAVERTKLLAVGGLSPTFALSFNDIDLSAKLAHQGYHSVVVDGVSIIHHETATREPLLTTDEIADWLDRWGQILDPWYHPGFVDLPHRANHTAPVSAPVAGPGTADEQTSPSSNAIPRTTELIQRVYLATPAAAT